MTEEVDMLQSSGQALKSRDTSYEKASGEDVMMMLISFWTMVDCCHVRSNIECVRYVDVSATSPFIPFLLPLPVLA